MLPIAGSLPVEVREVPAQVPDARQQAAATGHDATLCRTLLKTPCSCSCGSMTLWGWHTTSRSVFSVLVPLMTLLMMHQIHL